MLKFFGNQTFCGSNFPLTRCSSIDFACENSIQDLKDWILFLEFSRRNRVMQFSRQECSKVLSREYCWTHWHFLAVFTTRKHHFNVQNWLRPQKCSWLCMKRKWKSIIWEDFVTGNCQFVSPWKNSNLKGFRNFSPLRCRKLRRRFLLNFFPSFLLKSIYPGREQKNVRNLL